MRGFTLGGLGGGTFGLDCTTGGGLGFSGVTDRERGRIFSAGWSVGGELGDFLAAGDMGR